MSKKQWGMLGLFAVMVATVATLDMDTARKLVMVVGFVALLAASGHIADALKRAGG